MMKTTRYSLVLVSAMLVAMFAVPAIAAEPANNKEKPAAAKTRKQNGKHGLQQRNAAAKALKQKVEAQKHESK